MDVANNSYSINLNSLNPEEYFQNITQIENEITPRKVDDKLNTKLSISGKFKHFIVTKMPFLAPKSWIEQAKVEDDITYKAPYKFIMDRKLSILDKFKVFIVTKITFLAPESWKKQLIAEAGIVISQIRNKWSVLPSGMQMVITGASAATPGGSFEKYPLFCPRGTPFPISSRYLPLPITLDCYAIEALYANGLISSKDNFDSINTMDKFYDFCYTNTTKIQKILLKNIGGRNNLKDKINFNKDSFRDILINIVQEINEEEIGYERSYRWNIEFKTGI